MQHQLRAVRIFFRKHQFNLKSRKNKLEEGF